jgi:hypothetical protein
MKTTRKTQITVETHRVFTIRHHSRYHLGWCPECGPQAHMVTADEAAILCRVSSRAIYLRIEAHELHFKETPDGLLLVCVNSLAIRT